MQQVSQDWIDANTQQFLPLNDVKIFYYGENNDIASRYRYSDLRNTGSGSSTYWDTTKSNVEDIRDKTAMYNPYSKYITLDNTFVLDGSFDTIDNASSLRGAITMPNAYGTNVTIWMRFQAITDTLDYITIKWSEVFGVSPYSVTIKSQNTGVVADSVVHILEDNEFISEIELNFSNFNEIIIEIVSAQNNVPTRVEQVIFGHFMVFEKKDIIKYTQKNTIEPCTFTLPTHTFDFELDNVDGRFNPDNPSGVYKYLKEGQQVSFIYGLKINNSFEYINGGTFYILSWEVPQNSITATFRAGSKIDLMGEIFDVSQLGTYPITNKSLTQIARETGRQSNVVVDTSTSGSMSGMYPRIETETGYRCNDILQLCVNAGQCILVVDRDGNVSVVHDNSGTITDYKITKDISYKNADYNIRRTLKEIVINDNHYTSTEINGVTIQFDSNGETQTISNPFALQNYDTTFVQWLYNILKYNKIVKGEFRADARLDVMDKVTVYNRYSSALPVLITTINYEYNGALKGYYEGLVLQ